MNRFRFVDLFSGIGGFHQAMEQLGGECVLAAEIEISDDDLDRLRARCVREVKQTNGSVNFKDAVRYQRGEE